VHDLGLAGEDEFDGTLEVRDIQRFVREVQYENVAQTVPPPRKMQKRGIINLAFLQTPFEFRLAVA
jgi:hypothetical protein